MSAVSYRSAIAQDGMRRPPERNTVGAGRGGARETEGGGGERVIVVTGSAVSVLAWTGIQTKSSELKHIKQAKIKN